MFSFPLLAIALKYLAGAGGVVGFGALAWFAVSPRVKLAAVACAAAIFVGMVCYSWGSHDTNELWRAREVAANKQEIKNGEQARVDGDAAVDRAGDDGMRNDRFNRDARSK